MKRNMKTKTKPRKEARNKPTLVAFLLDRTGSMAACKDETIKGFNGYIDELRKNKNGEMLFTLTQFDSIAVDIIHDAEPLEKVRKLNNDTYEPRANTPLYDAIGKTIRATEQSAGSKYKVLFVTLTDGQENASSEWNEKTIKELIKEKESKNHWTFVHIGVGANGWDAAHRISVGTRSAANVLNINIADTGETYSRMACMTRGFSADLSNVAESATNLWKGPQTKDKKKRS